MKRVAALVAVLALLGLGTWLVWPSGSPPRAQDQRIEVVDGPADDQRIALDTTYFPPSGEGKAPAVLLAHGFGGSKQSVRDQAERLAADGYAVLTWSARGFGRSTGQIALNSPDYEVKDVKQLIDWLAKRPEVRLDAAGDPRVGIAGGSYGGAISLMAAAADARIDAIVPQITWYDLADALFPDASGQGPENGVFKRMWAGFFFGRGGPVQGLDALTQRPVELSADQARCGRFVPEICEMYQQVARTGKATPQAVALLRKSSPSSVTGRIKAPTLLIQGQRDSLFPIGQADANARALAPGTPVSIAWYDGGHDGGNGEPDWLYDQTTSWFTHYLKNAPTGQSAPLGPTAADPQGTSTTDPQATTIGNSQGTSIGGLPVAAFTVTRDGGRDPGTRQRIQLHPETTKYPGISGSTTTNVILTGAEQNVVNPPGGAPAAISTVPGVGGLLGGNTTATGIALDMPGQNASFESTPLKAPLQLTGGPTTKLRVYGKGQVTLFAKLYDVADTAQPPTLPAGLVAPFRVTIPEGKVSADVTVQLPVVDHTFPVGHRLRLTVATTDMGYATPAEPASYRIGLAAPALAVPTVPALETPTTGVAWWVWAMPLAAIAIAAGILATGRLPRPRTTPPASPKPQPTPINAASEGTPQTVSASPEAGSAAPEAPTEGVGVPIGVVPKAASAAAEAVRLTSGAGGVAAEGTSGVGDGPVPLEITGLTKAYRNGEKAVDDLSFKVEHGQVLGLLGPNGAGKTTTMRMMMGLILPDAGQIRIFGQEVAPGAPVLSRLGSFVEGPGFLPHLTGRDNLELYWAATGRPIEDAYLEEALEIADLGKALQRAVRTYSQGMRQRLAIAQAMLGLPDLLVLDEPTNGLDPPQIREMREVLKQYARDGRTVIVSSHMLAEVEQTCSHVVVMHRGRLVSAGPVATLLARSNGHGSNGHGPRLEDVFLDLIGEQR